jgi:WD40 repeat protein
MLVLRHPREVLITGFSPDGKSVVTAAGDGAARIWDADSGSETMVLANSGYVRSSSSLLTAVTSYRRQLRPDLERGDGN